jgi:hypothetical protein
MCRECVESSVVENGGALVASDVEDCGALASFPGEFHHESFRRGARCFSLQTRRASCPT